MKKASLRISTLAVVALLGIGLGTLPTGCASQKSISKEDNTPKSATTTTAAHGTMQAGARSHKHKTLASPH